MTPSAPEFLLLGEPLALDLVNTRAHRDGAEVDLLTRTGDLSAWLRAERGRIAWSGAATAADLARVRALRDAIDPLVRARNPHTPPPARAVRALNRALAMAPPRARLVWTRAGPRQSSLARGAQCAALLRRIALDALELVTGPDAGRLRQCAHPDCILTFVAHDARRRWCSDVCGNRARVARHYALRREAV